MTLIKDIALVKEFCEKVIPELDEDMVLLGMIAARKKYSEDISRSYEVLHRWFIRNNNVNRIIQKIKYFSQVSDIFIDSKSGKVIPERAMVMYIDLNPKSMVKGYIRFVKETTDWIYESYVSPSTNINRFKKLDVKLFSCIHKSNAGRPPYVLVDIDDKNTSTLSKVIDLLDKEIVWISETRGGYHVIVNNHKYVGEIIHREVKNIQNVEIQKEVMTPVPGTLQGGFVVRKVEW